MKHQQGLQMIQQHCQHWPLCTPSTSSLVPAMSSQTPVASAPLAAGTGGRKKPLLKNAKMSKVLCGDAIAGRPLPQASALAEVLTTARVQNVEMPRDPHIAGTVAFD